MDVIKIPYLRGGPYDQYIYKALCHNTKMYEGAEENPIEIDGGIIQRTAKYSTIAINEKDTDILFITICHNYKDMFKNISDKNVFVEKVLRMIGYHPYHIKTELVEDE